MNYIIHITNTAQRDILNAADYIEFVLKNPKAADNLLDHAEHTILPIFLKNSLSWTILFYHRGGFALLR